MRGFKTNTRAETQLKVILLDDRKVRIGRLSVVLLNVIVNLLFRNPVARGAEVFRTKGVLPHIAFSDEQILLQFAWSADLSLSS